MTHYETFQDISPLSLLTELYNSRANGCLQVLSSQVSWWIYFEHGKIAYASHSVEPIERLERHTRRFGFEMSDIIRNTYNQVQPTLDSNETDIKNIDYIIICSLLNQGYLDKIQASALSDELVKEVIEALAWVKEGIYKFVNLSIGLPSLSRLDVKILTEYCQKRLQVWQTLVPEISSPYQRLCCEDQSHKLRKFLPDLKKIQFSELLVDRLSILLKGLSLRQLAVFLNQDEIKLIQSLLPYILDGTIILKEPQEPFDHLPNIPQLYSDLNQLYLSTLVDVETYVSLCF